MEQATLPAPAFEELFKGEIVRSGDATYDELRKFFNAMIDRRPATSSACRRPSARRSTSGQNIPPSAG